MPFYEHHVFVCTHRRDPNHPRGSCAQKGSEAICSAFKEAVRQSGSQGNIRINAAGCLDQCDQGPSVVVYPEQVWYRIETPADASLVAQEHLVLGRPVESLKMSESKKDREKVKR